LRKKAQVNKRWDITVGLFAAGIAILGLISSIATSNREFLFGNAALADRKALLAITVAVGALTALKSWLAKRRPRD
jgi:ABC-type Mn2+/Zn2+ transport system permease subunit